jgi:capsular exopolysaccharide synthesis family protein
VPQYELNLRDYLRIFRKRKAIIIVTFIIVTLASIILMPKQPVIYTAVTTIKIEERKTIAGLLTEWIAYNPGDIMQSEAKFITSFPVMIRVGIEQGLIFAEWFEEPQDKTIDIKKRELSHVNIKPGHIEEVNRIVGMLQGKVQTEIIPSTNMIKILATSDKPREAMDLANTVAKSYVSENLKEKNKQATRAREFIEDQLKELEKNIKEGEERLRRLGQGSQQVSLAEPLEQKLVELQFKLAELLQRYTEKHPQVIQLRDQIKSMEGQVQGMSEQQLEYSRINREVVVNRKLYEMLKEKLEEARISEREKVSDVTVVDPAVMPRAPITVDNRIKIIVGAMMGMVLGIVFAFVLETLDTSIGTIEDVESVIKLPVLGVVPSIEEESGKNKWLLTKIKERFIPSHKTEKDERFIHLFAHYQPHSPITEAFRNIHTNLKLRSDRKAILVTSSGPREGKSTILCNLGLVMAQIGLKTLLVSTDLRRPILAKIFGIKREPGLSELVMGTATLDGVLNNITDILLGSIGLEDIKKTPGIENIWILTSGRLSDNPVEILESKALADLIEKAKQRFDVILFDAPPVLPVTDPSLLAAKVDCVLIVYEIGKTSREGLLRAKIQLESVGAKIAGIVLNHTQPQTESSYPYLYYGKQKYKYYPKEEGSANKQKEDNNQQKA